MTLLPFLVLHVFGRRRHTRTSGIICSKMYSSLNIEPKISTRISQTDEPIVTHMRKLMGIKSGTLSLAQGIVYWCPPAEAFTEMSHMLNAGNKAIHGYCSNYGTPELQDRIIRKLNAQGIIDSEVMVTAGANQGFTNLVIALLDPSDTAVLFRPYYFNHMMAFQMTGGANTVVVGDVDDELVPDMVWLEKHLADSPSTKMVVICNPCNPTGIMYPREMLLRAKALCAAAGAWLAVDNTYDSFSYEDESHLAHHTVEGPNVVNIFSMSKAFGTFS